MDKKTNKKLNSNTKALIKKCLICFYVLVFSISVYNLVLNSVRLRREAKTYDELAMLLTEAVEEAEQVEEISPQPEPQEVASAPAIETPEPEKPLPPKRSAGYKKLKEMNNDFYGWLVIQNTKVNYPVMHREGSPEFYLRKDFYKNYALSGSLFVDYRSVGDSLNTLIYGHHMKNGVMFGGLSYFADPNYYENHKFIEFDTMDTTAKYQVIAAFESKIYKSGEEGFRYYNYAEITSEEAYNEYVQGILEASAIDVGIVPEYGTELLTLSTCNYHTENGRFVVVAAKID